MVEFEADVVHFKFLVDGEWKFSMDYETCNDGQV
jgi:hypothetical protein